MDFDVMVCLEMETSNVNKAFNEVFEWMRDINMAEESDEILNKLAERVRHDNPFNCFVSGKYDFDPTNKMIRMIFELAEEAIKEKFPDAVITYKVNGYNSKFKIDDATYDKGWAEYQKEKAE